jgi:cytochrome c oxidase subunit 2
MHAPFLGSLFDGGTFWLPYAGSTFAASHDALFYFVLALNIIFFIGIVGAMGYFAWAYKRRSADQKTSNIRGSHTIEIAWSAIPSVFLVAIFVWGFVGFSDMVVPPSDAIDIRVTGQKWSWAYTYPNGATSSELIVPVGRPVRLTMTSTDVLHSFYVPAFRIKRDVVPNRYTVQWFEATQVGDFQVFCTEYCGDSHSAMLSNVEVVEADTWEERIRSLGNCPDDPDGLVACGEAVYRGACQSCHSVNGSRLTGPTFQGLFGASRENTDGSTFTADEDYIANSIRNPGDYIVPGYPNAMPANFGTQLSESQIIGLVAYIKAQQ